MARTLFTNTMIFEGTGKTLVPGEVRRIFLFNVDFLVCKDPWYQHVPSDE